MSTLSSPMHFDLPRLLESEQLWRPFRQGIEIQPLYGDVGAGAAAAMLRYQPGSALPRHRHAGFEHIWVLSGSQRDASGEYGPGSFIVNPPDSTHSVDSPEGCIVMVVWERPVRFEESC